MALSFKQINIHKKIKNLDNVVTEQIFSYEREIDICQLKSKSVKKTYYDKESKMYFESSELYNTYEIEVKNVFLDLDKEIRKSLDFLRRLNYKYDWIQIEKCSNGKISQILNLEELCRNWIKLKEKLLKDYVGQKVELYCDKISNDFSDDSHFQSIFNQYFEYGLLFPPIPDKHRADWYNNRTITLDHHSDNALIETIRFVEELENKRKYSIELIKQDDSPLSKINVVTGELVYCSLTHSILHSEVNVVYSYDDTIENEYSFRIDKISI